MFPAGERERPGGGDAGPGASAGERREGMVEESFSERTENSTLNDLETEVFKFKLSLDGRGRVRGGGVDSLPCKISIVLPFWADYYTVVLREKLRKD